MVLKVRDFDWLLEDVGQRLFNGGWSEEPALIGLRKRACGQRLLEQITGLIAAGGFMVRVFKRSLCRVSREMIASSTSASTMCRRPSSASARRHVCLPRLCTYAGRPFARFTIFHVASPSYAFQLSQTHVEHVMQFALMHARHRDLFDAALNRCMFLDQFGHIVCHANDDERNVRTFIGQRLLEYSPSMCGLLGPELR